MNTTFGTTFTPASTNHNSNPNGEIIPTMMSAEGKKLAAKTAPQSAFNTKLVKGGK
jgi:hypothetical protein